MLTIENEQRCQARIKVFGIGGGGCNAVNRMVEMSLAGIDFISANTDMQALANSQSKSNLQLGANLTRGLGAGGNPDIGREAALEDEDTIRMYLEDSDMVFITAGMGGGTGTGAAPVVARLAKEKGALTIAVVTKPFRFEGKRRENIAEAGIRELEEFADTLIIIPNQKLLQTVERNTTLTEAFKLADDVLCQAVQGISDLITIPGLINLDFADVKSIMSGMGKALMGTGIGEGDAKAEKAIQRAISSPLLDDMTVEGARGILINVTGGDDLTLMELESALEIIRTAADEDVNIIFGTVLNSSYHNRVKATVIATGFEIPTAKMMSRSSTEKTSFGPAIDPGISLERNRTQTEKKSSSISIASTPVPEPSIIQQDTAMNEATHHEEENHEEYPDHEEGNIVSHAPSKEVHAVPAVETSKKRETIVSDSALEDTSPGHTVAATSRQPQTDLQTSPLQAVSKEPDLSEQASDPSIPDQPEPHNSPNILPFSTNIPQYKRTDLSQDSFIKKPVTEGKQDIAVDSSNYMVPAFLRRKAD